MPTEQFGFALAHALVQRDHQRAVLARHAREALYQHGTHQQRKQHHGVWHERQRAGAVPMQAHHPPVANARTHQRRSGHERSDGLPAALLPGGLRQRQPGQHGGYGQRRQHQGPEDGQPEQIRGRADQDVDGHHGAKPQRVQQLLPVHQHQGEVDHQHQVQGECPGRHHAPQRPGQRGMLDQPVAHAQHASGRSQAEHQIQAVALRPPEAGGHQRHQSQHRADHQAAVLAQAVVVTVERVHLVARAHPGCRQPAPARRLGADPHLHAGGRVALGVLDFGQGHPDRPLGGIGGGVAQLAGVVDAPAVQPDLDLVAGARQVQRARGARPGGRDVEAVAGQAVLAGKALVPAVRQRNLQGLRDGAFWFEDGVRTGHPLGCGSCRQPGRAQDGD